MISMSSLWQEVQNQIPHIAYARMTSFKFSKFNFTAAVDNIYAQFVPVNRGLNSAYIMLQQPLKSTSGMRE